MCNETVLLSGDGEIKCMLIREMYNSACETSSQKQYSANAFHFSVVLFASMATINM